MSETENQKRRLASEAVDHHVMPSSAQPPKVAMEVALSSRVRYRSQPSREDVECVIGLAHGVECFCES